MARKLLFKLQDPDPPYDFVEVKRTGDHPVPAEFRDRILIHTIHDGAYLPRDYLYDDSGKPRYDVNAVEKRYIEERDWGANLVAHKIAAALGVAGFARCRLARVLLDFNRFPGSTPHDGEGVQPLERLAINYPFSNVLPHAAKVRLLEHYYDRISDYIEKNLLDNKLILIAVHTYDEHNPTHTRRPHVSLINAVLNYTREARMPYGVFDPMYPDILGESTCSRVLRDRISLNLERNGYRVSHNHPYPLPEGSMEVRAQVWFFFSYLRARFEEKHPATRSDPAYKLVWMMLLNTNLRLAQAEALRSYLHRFRRVSGPQKQRLVQAQRAYDKINAFLASGNVVHEFRRSTDRPSSLGVEVRKDLVCSFDEKGRPTPAGERQVDNATLIGNTIASAITTFFETDRQHQ